MKEKDNYIFDITKPGGITTNSTIKNMNEIFNRPEFKNAIESLKQDYQKPLLDINRYDISGERMNSFMREMEESNRRKEKDKQAFFNNTQIIAESNVALVNFNEQILKTNNQLLSCNEVLVSQNNSLLRQLTGMNEQLNNLSEEIVLSSRVQEVLGVEHIDKLDEIVKILNNPSDENLMNKISKSFIDIPPQVVIALVVEGLKKSLGIGV